MQRILIADDHAVIRSGIRQILIEEFAPAHIEEATDTTSLIEKALSQEWDIIISDISMPGGGGFEALKQIREKKPQQKILILSVYLADQYATHSLKAGANGFLNKDTASDELSRAVKMILAGDHYFPPGINP